MMVEVAEEVGAPRDSRGHRGSPTELDEDGGEVHEGRGHGALGLGASERREDDGDDNMVSPER